MGRAGSADDASPVHTVWRPCPCGWVFAAVGRESTCFATECSSTAPLLLARCLRPRWSAISKSGSSELTQDFFAWLERCGPFGVGNREPLLMTRGVTLAASVRFIKERHICLQMNERGSAEIQRAGMEPAARVACPLCREMGLAGGGGLTWPTG